MNTDELRQRVSQHQWFHSIDLGDGIVTPGAKSLKVLRREADVTFKHGVAGKTVLDIGAWDGANSFEAERRGAARVVASDHFCWVGHGWGKKAAFDFAKCALGSRVEEKISPAEELSPETVGIFDVVLFLGVLYHLKNPLLGLERAAALTRDLLVVETVTRLDYSKKPLMLFLPGSELNNDPTNWWVPNTACVKAMLSTAGFTKIEVTVIPETARVTFHAWK